MPTFIEARTGRTIRRWALLDLIVTGAFALPPLLPLFLAVVYALNGALGGADTPPTLAPLHAFFMCLAGALGVLWAVVRIRTPTPTLASRPTESGSCIPRCGRVSRRFG